MTIFSDTPSGIGIREAAGRIEALLTASEADNQNAEAAAPAPKAAKTEDKAVEAPAAEAEADETPPSENGEGTENAEAADADDSAIGSAEHDEEGAAEGDEATAEDDDDPAQADDPLTQTYTVKIGGKEEKVTLKEALAGYQRTADYTRKSQSLAEEKKAFEPERDAVKLERTQYAQLLPALIEQIKGTLLTEPDIALLDTNPVEYIRQEKLMQDQRERLAAAYSEQARLNDLAEKEAQAQAAKAVRESGIELAKAMPQWKNPEKWAADREKLLAYGQTQGWSPDDLKATSDHRAILALYKAMRYDEMMAKRAKPTPTTGPTPAKAGNSAAKPSRTVSDITRAKQRLAKTGRVRDAASIFEQLL